jgi:lysophospholipase L1-like esterase
MPEKLNDEFLQFARNYPRRNDRRPERFIKMMRANKGAVSLSPDSLDEDGLQRKNPVIAALGDSVTAGHFEFISDDPAYFAVAAKEGKPVEITDAREGYSDKFRMALIDKYEETSVSVINAGIAGDTIFGMNARLTRDVIRYDPDLVLINGSLNWPNRPTADFHSTLQSIVRRIKSETNADIILLTPNMVSEKNLFELFSSMMPKGNNRPTPPPPQSTLDERVDSIRAIAEEEEVCIADVFAVWKAFGKTGAELESMFANGINHPTKAGHEVYSITLMKLFE